MVLALVTLKAVLELSPFNSSSVPPDKTGLGPIEASPTLVPLEIFDTYVAMNKFQIPDVGVVCVNSNV